MNSSDEEDNNPENFAENSKQTVLHFKRKFKSGAAADLKRRRAGRFGRQAGEAGDDEESELSCDSDASSEYSDDEDNNP